MTRRLALLLLAALLAAPVAATSHARPTDAAASAACTRYDARTLAKAQAVANRARASVVVVETDGGTGTGFAVSGDGILTNHHVVEGAANFAVRLLDGRRLAAQLVRTANNEPDAALLRVQGGHGLRPLPIGRVAGLKRNQPVVAVGHPAISTEWTATVGRLSAVSYWGLGPRWREVESNTPGAAGQSGSPLLDLSGKVIGIIHGPKRGFVGAAPKPGSPIIRTRIISQTMSLAAAIPDALMAVGLTELVAPSERTVPSPRPSPPDLAANCAPASGADFDRGTLGRAQTVADRARSSVVAISTDGSPNGTGWVVAPGIVMTNEHVVAGAQSLGVWLVDGRHFPAELIGATRPPDVAFLRVPLPANVEPLPTGASASLRPGDPLVVVGHPADAGAGWVATLGRFTGIEDDGSTIASTVPGGEGSSGSPILSLDGTVVGVIHSGRFPERPLGPGSQKVRTFLADATTALGAPIEHAVEFGRSVGALP